MKKEETDEKNQSGMPLFQVLRRMLQNMAQKDRKQIIRILLFTLAAGIYPLFAVFLPKIAIGILEQGGQEAARKLMTAIAVYLGAAGLTGTVKVYLDNVIRVHNT